MESSREQNVGGSQFAELPRAYVNAVKVTYSLYDFQFVLGNQFVDNLAEEPAQVLQPMFVAQMSPHHFKVFTAMLNTQLFAYEKAFGEINVPPKDVKGNKTEG